MYGGAYRLRHSCFSPVGVWLFSRVLLEQMFSECAEYTTFLNWHFFIYVNSRLLCCCPFEMVREGVESPNNVSFLQHYEAEAFQSSALPTSPAGRDLWLSSRCHLFFLWSFFPSDCWNLVFLHRDFFSWSKLKYINAQYRRQFSLLGLYLVQIVEFR